MLRCASLLSAMMAVVLVTCIASAQESRIERQSPRIQLPKVPDKIGPDVIVVGPGRSAGEENVARRTPRSADRGTALGKTKIHIAPRVAPDRLTELGARAPFGSSARGTFLVGAVRDGSGLALWETSSHKRLRMLDDSDREYSLVAISPEARWIAGVRRDDADQIDLWRADNGRHVRVIQAAGGRKSKLEFVSGQLEVATLHGTTLIFNVPSGEPAGSSSNGQASQSPEQRFETMRRAIPTAPSAIAPPLPPPIQPSPSHSFTKDFAPIAPPPTAQNAPPIETRIPPFPVPSAAVPRMAPPRAIIREPVEPPMDDDEPRGTISDESVGSAAPSPWPTAAAPYEPSGGSAPPMPEDVSIFPGGAQAPNGSGAPPPMLSLDNLDSPGPGSAAPTEPPAQYRFEMRAEPEEEMTEEASEPAAAAPANDEMTVADSDADVAADAEAKPASSVSIHYATNRNRLAPKDREWRIYFRGFFSTLPAFVVYGLMVLALLILPWFGKRSWAASAVLVGACGLCAMGGLEAYVRSRLRNELTGELYGCRATDISYGVCEISVPPAGNRQAGDVSRPLSVWIFDAPENDEEHFTLRHVEEHPDKNAFYKSLSARLEKTDEKAAFLFIHGYNVCFEDAIFRTAQLAVDLKFQGAPIAFCWPSYADPVKYAFDETNAEVSIPALREVLDDLTSRSGAKRVHIIAHSMGNRVLAGALRYMDAAAQVRNKEVIRELVLAAPDIDSRVFKSQVLPYIVQNTQHCTLYASSRDRALLMSRCFHNYQRLGEAKPELLVDSGLDTIDASLVDTSLLGHSYIGDVESIVADLHDLVVAGKRAAERMGLETLERNALKYWSIKPQLETASDSGMRR